MATKSMKMEKKKKRLIFFIFLSQKKSSVIDTITVIKNPLVITLSYLYKNARFNIRSKRP